MTRPAGDAVAAAGDAPPWSKPPIPETAGLGPRFVAFAVDLMLASGIFVLVAAAVLGSLGVAESLRFRVDLEALILPLLFLYFPTLLLYFTLAEGLWGATVGKQVMGLRVVRADGSPVSLFDSFIRNVLRFLWFVPVVGIAFLLLDLWLIHRGEMDQRIGDRGAETIVTRTRPAAG